MSDYNGWKNKETWLVNTYFGDAWYEMSNNNELREWTADNFEEYVLEFTDGTGGFLDEVVGTFLANVDWEEIASHYIIKENKMNNRGDNMNTIADEYKALVESIVDLCEQGKSVQEIASVVPNVPREWIIFTAHYFGYDKGYRVKEYDKRHGGPWDRGSADAYYGRPRSPHCFEGASYSSREITKNLMTDEEIEAYNAGYDGETNRKDW